MKNEIVTKLKSEVALPDAPESAWGAEDARSSDLLIPKILLMQGLSDLVSQEKAKMGDIVNSVSGKIIGGKEKPLRLIPIKVFNSWVIQEKIGDKLEYKETIPMTASNEGMAWEEEVNGVLVKRDKTINVYVLLEDEAEKPDTIPYLISFRRTSYGEGRKLATHFLLSKNVNQPPARRVFELSCHKEQNDDGTYYVFDVAESTDTSKKHLAIAYSWFKVINSGAAKVDDSDLKAAPVSEREAPPAKETAERTVSKY